MDNIKRGIVITTSKFTKDFLRNCLLSLPSNYDILVVSNGGYTPELPGIPWINQAELIVNDWNGWELGGIEQGKKRFDEFVHLMDTTLIKDKSLFDKLFAIKGNVVLTKGNFHYMGKFLTKELPNLPKVHSKELAIYLEVRWLDGFKYTEFSPDLPVHTNVFETIHGKKRMKLENDYMIKWKGTWWASPEHPIPN